MLVSGTLTPNHMKIKSFFSLAALITVAVALAAFAAPRLAPLALAPNFTAPVSAAAIDHGGFDKVLKKNVNAKGLVDYKALKADPAALDQYLALVSKNPPAASWSKNEQMAYWINAYNAYTIRLILDHYPLNSIKDIGSKIKIPFVTTPWAAKFFSIGGKKMSLDNIEHGTLRKNYNDPRIHFALVCASYSCPRLRNEAYTAARLDAQLDDQGRDFLNNPAKNKPGKASAQLSKYFDWYKGDWEKNGQSVPAWVNKYSTVKMDPKATVSYLDYNWSLNAQ